MDDEQKRAIARVLVASAVTVAAIAGLSVLGGVTPVAPLALVFLVSILVLPVAVGFGDMSHSKGTTRIRQFGGKASGSSAVLPFRAVVAFYFGGLAVGSALCMAAFV